MRLHSSMIALYGQYYNSSAEQQANTYQLQQLAGAELLYFTAMFVALAQSSLQVHAVYICCVIPRF